MDMLRSICLRNVALRSGLKKVSRSTFVRSLANESFRKRHIQRYPLSNARLTHLALRVPWTESIRHYSSDYPAHSRVLLPALSPTMELGTIVSWEKKEGDKLNEGDLLAEIETDKATMGFETPEEGYLAKILIPAGSKDVPIGKLVCIIVENQADVAAFKDFKDTAAPAPAKAAAATGAPVAAPVPGSPPPVPSPSPTAEPTGMKPGRLFASPMAKKLAETHNIRLEARLIREGKHAPGAGTGLYNSITSRDVAGMSPTSAKPAASAPAASFSPSGPSTNPFVDTPVTGVRATIARRLLESKQTIPHYYLSCNVDVDRITALRQEFNKLKEKEGVRLTVTDFIIKAAAMACRRVPEANSHWLDNVIRQYEQVDMSVAVATDRGLITPIVFGADRRGLVEISRDVKSLAAKAKEGKLAASEYQGGTFTISNLGMFNITQFCAIINPPHSCILAVGGTQSRAVSDPSSEHGIRFASFITVTLSCDHRVVDGAVGARWMQAFRENIENPYAMLL